jgi:hypothetical protein
MIILFFNESVKLNIPIILDGKRWFGLGICYDMINFREDVFLCCKFSLFFIARGELIWRYSYGARWYVPNSILTTILIILFLFLYNH